MTAGTGPHLFRPLRLRGLEVRNRVVLSPMCQYKAVEGRIVDWHLHHHARFAMGGLGIAFVEATAVTRDGRIGHGCTGLWEDGQIEGMRRICDVYHAYGVAPAIQLGHAGRKASTRRPWDGADPIQPGDAEPPWETVAPSALPGRPGWHVPRALEASEIPGIVAAFGQAARRAREAGFRIAEIHGAHGYLIHSFFSPLSNRRDDAWGGDLHRRMRFALEVADAMRAEWPADLPLFYRASAVDGGGEGIAIEDTIELAKALKARGVDVIDCSSGGIAGTTTLGRQHPGYGFQVPLARAVRRGADMPTMAVGFITTPELAERTVAEGSADLVAIARELMSDPNWTYRAALALGAERPHWVLPDPYAWYLERRDQLEPPPERDAAD